MDPSWDSGSSINNLKKWIINNNHISSINQWISRNGSRHIFPGFPAIWIMDHVPIIDFQLFGIFLGGATVHDPLSHDGSTVLVYMLT